MCPRPPCRRPPRHRASAPLLALGMVLALSACTLRPPHSSEEFTADSQSLPPSVVAGGVVSPPFCLHIRYRNTFYGLYSDTRAEAWTTEGPCASTGARRVVDNLRLGWRHDAPWDTQQQQRQCMRTDVCSNHAQDVIEGKNMRCVMARATDGNQSAYLSSDQTACR